MRLKFIIAVTAGISVLNIASGQEDDFNILKNSDFEAQTADWNAGKIEYAEGGVKGGKAARLKTDTPAPPNGFRCALYQNIKNPPGGKYVLSGYFRGNDLNAIYIVLRFKPDSKGSFNVFRHSSKFEKAGVPGWNIFSEPLEIPENQTDAELVIQPFTKENGMTAEFDKITLVRQTD